MAQTPLLIALKTGFVSKSLMLFKNQFPVAPNYYLNKQMAELHLFSLF